jgi:ssDNA-binding Zn-finger/Zn-ribbon topoisomerase 1
VAKRTRYGTLYLCANGPECDFKTWLRLVERACPLCSYPLGEASFRGRPSGKIKCSNPDCAYQERAEAGEAAA